MVKARAKKDQRSRFIEAAKKSGADETGEAFERAFKKIVKPRAPAKNQKKA